MTNDERRQRKQCESQIVRHIGKKTEEGHLFTYQDPHSLNASPFPAPHQVVLSLVFEPEYAHTPIFIFVFHFHFDTYFPNKVILISCHDEAATVGSVTLKLTL